MTGEVVDLHSMIGVKLYNNIAIDPFHFAVENQPEQMPHLWEDMKVYPFFFTRSKPP